MVYLLFGALDSVEANPGDSLIVGTQQVHKIGLESYKVVWSQEVIEPNGHKRDGINTITDSVKIAKNAAGYPEIRRVLKWEDINNNIYIKTDVLDYYTLRPKSIDVRWNPSYVQHTDITGNTLVSSTLKNEFASARVQVTQLDQVGITWSSDGFALIVAQNVPVGKFYLETLNGLPDQPTTGMREFENHGIEQISLGAFGDFSSKKITDLSADIKTTYWLSSIKPYVVQVRFEQPNGQITTWKIESIK